MFTSQDSNHDMRNSIVCFSVLLVVATLGTTPEALSNPVLQRGKTHRHGGIDHSMSVKNLPSGDTSDDRQSKKSGGRSRRQKAEDPEEESGSPAPNGSGSPVTEGCCRRLPSGYSMVSQFDSFRTYASDADEPTRYKFVIPEQEGPPEPNKSPRRERKVPPSGLAKIKSMLARKLSLPVAQLKKAATLPKRSPTLRNLHSSITESFLSKIFSINPSLRNPAQPLPDPVEVPVFKWHNLETITINGGDVLICQRWNFEVSRRIFFLFAINRYEVIYVYRPSNFHSLARIQVDRTLHLLTDLEHYIDTSNCKNLGNKGSNIRETIKRAMAWREKNVFYDSDGCWGYHWVMYWATGSPPEPRNKDSIIAGFNTPMHKNCRLNTILADPTPRRLHRVDMELHKQKKQISKKDYTYDWFWVDGQSISP